MGGVPLPTVTMTDGNGDSKPLDTCSPVNKWSDVSAYAQYIFPSQAELIGDEGTPKTDRLWFASPAQPPPIPVVDCATHMDLRLHGQYYTIVVSDDRQRPDCLKPNINWLPWGDEQYQKLFAVRHILPSDDFDYDVQDARDGGCLFNFDFPAIPPRDAIDDVGPTCEAVMGDYYPVALWCDKSTFLAGGFDACRRDGD